MKLKGAQKTQYNTRSWKKAQELGLQLKEESKKRQRARARKARKERKEAKQTSQQQGCGEQQLTQEQIKEGVLKGTIPFAVADSGATSSCVQPIGEQKLVSECENFVWQGEPYTKNGEEIK